MKFFSSNVFTWSFSPPMYLHEVFLLQCMYIKFFSSNVFTWSFSPPVYLHEVFLLQCMYMKFFSSNVFTCKCFSSKVFTWNFAPPMYLYEGWGCTFWAKRTFLTGWASRVRNYAVVSMWYFFQYIFFRTRAQKCGSGCANEFLGIHRSGWGWGWAQKTLLHPCRGMIL